MAVTKDSIGHFIQKIPFRYLYAAATQISLNIHPLWAIKALSCWQILLPLNLYPRAQRKHTSLWSGKGWSELLAMEENFRVSLQMTQPKMLQTIMIASPCHKPLGIPHIIQAEVGFAGVVIILLKTQIMDSSSNSTQNLCLENDQEKYYKFSFWMPFTELTKIVLYCKVMLSLSRTLVCCIGL